MFKDFENDPEAYGFGSWYPVAHEVAKNKGMTLLEQSNEMVSDGCDFDVLEFYFPDYQFKDNMYYYMQDENGTLYYGDKIPKEYWALKYPDYNPEQEENEPVEGTEEHA